MSLLDTASLIVTPNGYKEGKLYSVIPSDGSGDLSVTRATTATRVNSAGLVELVPYNLLQYSEQFDNAAWTKGNLTITSNNITAPDGTLTADRFNLNAGTSVKYAQQFAAQNNGAYTQSVYLKKGTHNFVQLLVGSDANPYCNFDLTNGTYSAFGSSATMTDVGNGWYRCTMSFSSSFGLDLYVWASNSLSSPRADSTSSTGYFYAWGFQLVEGSTAKDYQKTETRLNIPRLDYSNGTCPSLLVEPQRTNLLTYSSSFDNSAWVKYSTSINANTAISPSGIQDADKIVENSSTDIHLMIQGTQWDTNSRTASLYVKAAERTKFYIANTSAEYGSFFNLGTGTIDGNIGPFTSTIEDVGNGWYRITATHTASASQTFAIGIYTNYTGNFTTTTQYTGTTGSGLYIWGAQAEVGNYATSYIPTQGASVTRNADVISKTGISSLIGQTEGTLFIDFDFNGSGYGTTNDFFLYVGDGANTDAIYIDYYNNIFRWVVFNGSTLAFYTDLATTNGRHKLALGYKAGQYVAYADGNLILADTNATAPPTCAMLSLAQNVTGFGSMAKEINAAALWKTRLTNTQLQQLTTL
jgi:hypothetical protein